MYLIYNCGEYIAYLHIMDVFYDICALMISEVDNFTVKTMTIIVYIYNKSQNI